VNPKLLAFAWMLARAALVSAESAWVLWNEVTDADGKESILFRQHRPRRRATRI
jgi:hypothetical protein